jgi:hypothetical protein
MIQSDAVAALKGGNKGRIFNCFTPFNYGDVNTRTVLEGSYTPCVIPIAKAFDPVDDNLRATDIVSTWESYHPRVSIVQMVKEARRSNSISKLMQERMLRLTSSSDRLVPDKCLQFCDTALIAENIYAYNIYITTDYTTTSGEKSDFSAAAVWALGNNGDWFMLELALRKMGMDEQYKTTMDWAAKYKRMGKHVEIGVEVDGSQGAHVFSLEKMMMERSDWYTFARQANVDKEETRKGILSRKVGGSKHDRFRVAARNFLLPDFFRN